MDRKDLKTPMPVTATSKLSKKQKIIEIDLRSQKLGSPKRYHSQGGVPPQSSDFPIGNRLRISDHNSYIADSGPQGHQWASHGTFGGS